MWLGLVGLILLAFVILCYSACILCRRQAARSLPLVHVVRSGCGHPVVTPLLVCFRALVAPYALAVLIADISSHGWLSLCFFTVWNWILLMIYFILVTVARTTCTLNPSCAGVPREEAEISHNREVELPMPVDAEVHNDSRVVSGTTSEGKVCTCLARVCQVLCAMLVCNVMVVDVLVWTVLYPKSDTSHRANYRSSFFSLNMHVVNAPIVVVEVLLNDLPSDPDDVAYVLLLAVAYCCFNLIRVLVVPDIRHCLVEPCNMSGVHDRINGYIVWPYFFLDSSQWYTPLVYFSLVAVHMVFYLVGSWLRWRLATYRHVVRANMYQS